MRFSHFTCKTPEYRLSGNKKALNSVSSGLKILVPVAGLEPARIAPPHFECGASANSATPAKARCIIHEFTLICKRKITIGIGTGGLEENLAVLKILSLAS